MSSLKLTLGLAAIVAILSAGAAPIDPLGKRDGFSLLMSGDRCMYAHYPEFGPSVKTIPCGEIRSPGKGRVYRGLLWRNTSSGQLESKHRYWNKRLCLDDSEGSHLTLQPCSYEASQQWNTTGGSIKRPLYFSDMFDMSAFENSPSCIDIQPIDNRTTSGELISTYCEPVATQQWQWYKADGEFLDFDDPDLAAEVDDPEAAADVDDPKAAADVDDPKAAADVDDPKVAAKVVDLKAAADVVDPKAAADV